MKLFNGFEAVKFPQEKQILVTHNGYLNYCYNYKYGNWYKPSGAGSIHITVSNYPDVSRRELIKTLGGKFPEKETDIFLWN